MSDLEELLESLGEVDRALEVLDGAKDSLGGASPSQRVQYEKIVEDASGLVVFLKSALLILSALALEGRYAPRAKPIGPPAKSSTQDNTEYKKQLEQYQIKIEQWQMWTKRVAALGGGRLTLSAALRETYVSDCGPDSEGELERLCIDDRLIMRLVEREVFTHKELAKYINAHSGMLRVEIYPDKPAGDGKLLPKMSLAESKQSPSRSQPVS
ncbi:MAG: hypothetical protein HYT16_02030 [DPANN group archaeon]|nr:hypothetical protein [DPANN group archaeon]